ncbi:Chitinase 4 [Pleosporales sp. CAS-2024a]
MGVVLKRLLLGTTSLAKSNTRPTSTHVPFPKPPVDDRFGYRAVGYYGNWDIYARKYNPRQIPASQLTHLLYAFGDNTADGNITLSDSWADSDMHYPGDSWSDSGNNVYGNIKQLGLLKQANRNLKVLLSIGGWTYTNTKKDLDPVGASEAAQDKFAASCVNMVKNYGFDGIDVDWEYPSSADQGSQFLALMTKVRQALNKYAGDLAQDPTYAKAARPQFLLSIAAPAGADNYKYLPLEQLAGVLDMVNVMAYDYAGSWDNVTAHASNLGYSNANPKSTPYNTNSVISHYLGAGVPSNKINLGMPLYGRAFTNTAGLGQAYNGIGKGTWEAGVYDFKDLPLPGATEYFDSDAEATYSYDKSTGMLVSYDTVGMALTKAKFIQQNKLGGAMWWEVSGDRNDSGSIITNVVNALAGADGKGIESRANWIYYPNSTFANVKSGFAG